MKIRWTRLQSACPKDVDPRPDVEIDPYTPRKFDNMYLKILQLGMGLFTQDPVLFSDPRSRTRNSTAFYKAFVTAITRLGRVGVKNRKNGIFVMIVQFSIEKTIAANV